MTWWKIGIGTAVSVGTSYYSNEQQKKAAKQQIKAGQQGQAQSEDTMQQMFDQGQQATAPWRQSGAGALSKLNAIYGIDTGGAYSQPMQATQDQQVYNALSGGHAGTRPENPRQMIDKGAPVSYQNDGSLGAQVSPADREFTPQGRGLSLRDLDPKKNIESLGSHLEDQAKTIPTMFKDPAEAFKQQTMNTLDYGAEHFSGDSLQDMRDDAQAKAQRQGQTQAQAPNQYQDQMPYGAAPTTREAVMEEFHTSPGQQFQLEQANLAAKRQLAAGGFADSGLEMKELQRIAQGQASQEFGSYVSGLQSLAGLGQSSAGQTSSQSYGMGQNLGQQQYNQANMQGQQAAQSSIAQANIAGNVLGQGAQAFGQYIGQNQQAPAAQYNPSAYGMTTAAGDPVPDVPYGMRPQSQIPITGAA